MVEERPQKSERPFFFAGLDPSSLPHFSDIFLRFAPFLHAGHVLSPLPPPRSPEMGEMHP